MKYRKISELCKILDKKLIYSESGTNDVECGIPYGTQCGGTPQIGDVVLLRLAWCGDAYPGCFFQLQPKNEYLRRPISLCGSGEGYIELAIRVAGEGTRELVSRKIGETIECFGPLGRGFEMPQCPEIGDVEETNQSVDGDQNNQVSRSNLVLRTDRASYLIIGGGIGVAPLLPLFRSLRNDFGSATARESCRENIAREPRHEDIARKSDHEDICCNVDRDSDPKCERHQKSNCETPHIDFVVGFRGRPYFEQDATHICSEDVELDLGGYSGSNLGVDLNANLDSDLGAHRSVQTHYGTVLPIVSELLREHPHGGERAYDDIFICGPKKMLDALALLCMEHGYDPQLLTEAHMGCGVGACLVCTTEVRSKQKYARVCADGPMFRASELKFGIPIQCKTEGADSACDAPVSVIDLQGVSKCGSDGSTKHGSKCDTESDCISKCVTECTSGLISGRETGCEGKSSDVLSVSLGRLHLKSLLTMASGTFGFGREYDEFFDIGILGAVSVKGLTLSQKPGNPGRRVVEITGGMINSVGLQNPGVEHFIAHEAEFLRSKKIAVIANINGESVSDMVEMASIVDPHVDAIELNISCPNVSAGGMSFGTDPRMTAEIVRAVRKVSKSPLIVKLTPNVTNIVEIAKTCEAEGAEILSMINTVTGLAVDWNTGRKPLDRGFGGMSGAAVKPIALRCIDAVSSNVSIPILGMGGISSAKDVIEFLRVGASAVAIGTAVFRDPLLPVKIDADLRNILCLQGKKSVKEFYKQHKIL